MASGKGAKPHYSSSELGASSIEGPCCPAFSFDVYEFRNIILTHYILLFLDFGHH